MTTKRNSVIVPDGFIVWRDDDGSYHVAERPTELRGPLTSRTRAAQWLQSMAARRAWVIKNGTKAERNNEHA